MAWVAADKEIYSEISIKLKELSDMALRLSIGHQR